MISYKKQCAIESLSFIKEVRLKDFIRNYKKKTSSSAPKEKSNG